VPKGIYIFVTSNMYIRTKEFRENIQDLNEKVIKSNRS